MGFLDPEAERERQPEVVSTNGFKARVQDLPVKLALFDAKPLHDLLGQVFIACQQSDAPRVPQLHSHRYIETEPDRTERFFLNRLGSDVVSCSVMMTIQEIADAWKVSVPTARRILRSNKRMVKPIRFGYRTVRYRPADVDALTAQQAGDLVSTQTRRPRRD